MQGRQPTRGTCLIFGKRICFSFGGVNLQLRLRSEPRAFKFKLSTCFLRVSNRFTTPGHPSQQLLFRRKLCSVWDPTWTFWSLNNMQSALHCISGLPVHLGKFLFGAKPACTDCRSVFTDCRASIRLVLSYLRETGKQRERANMSRTLLSSPGS